MTKLRDPLSVPGAFARSVFTLGPDPSTGADGIERAAQLTGTTTSALYKAVDPNPHGKPYPVDIRAAELLDAVHVREHGIAYNFDAWQARRDLIGVGDISPSAERLIEDAIADVRDAQRAMRAGRSAYAAVNRLLPDLVRAVANLMDEVGDLRVIDAGRQTNRRNSGLADLDQVVDDANRLVAGGRHSGIR